MESLELWPWEKGHWILFLVGLVTSSVTSGKSGGVRSKEGVSVQNALPGAEGCGWTCEHSDSFRQPFVLGPE